MSNSVVVLTYFLITFVLPSFQEAASGHCSLDAALSYTGDNRMYLCTCLRETSMVYGMTLLILWSPLEVRLK